MHRHALHCALCLGVILVACDDPDSGGAPALELSQLSRTWQFVDSRFTVDSVVCGITCFTSSTAWETLAIGADSSFSRVACTASAGRTVFSHSQSCSTTVVNSPESNTVCELDSGRCSIADGSLCLAGGSATACFTASLSGDGAVLTLVDTLGVSRSYVASETP